MLDRRSFVTALGATAALAACGGPPGPALVAVNVAGGRGMNPGPDGADRPVTVTVLRLRDAGAFAGADYFALLEDPAAALGAALLGVDQIAVAPGGRASKVVVFEPEATQIGVVAALREPTGKTWRAMAPVAAGEPATAAVTLGPAGLTLAMS